MGLIALLLARLLMGAAEPMTMGLAVHGAAPPPPVTEAAAPAAESAGATAESDPIQCDGQSVCVDRRTGRPLRALPRAGAHLYKSPDPAPENILAENVRAFMPVHVFARQDLDLSDPENPRGWYQVGPGTTRGVGWMRAADLLEWHQALLAAYTHPGTGADARQPVLMFADRAALDAMVEADDPAAAAQSHYQAIAAGLTPPGVVSIEPERFVDITGNFYVLPILDHGPVDVFDEETRRLRLAAAVPGQRSGPDDRTVLADPGFQAEATAAPLLDAEAGRALTVDIVFVMDLTSSMGPFIDRTRDAVTDIARRLAERPELGEAVRFGLVGYRDDVATLPDQEFTSRLFTPVLLNAEDFIALVDEEVRPAAAPSDDYAEEGFAGFATALDAVRWSDGLRFVILVGDASAHEPDHPQSTTGLSAAELRARADDAGLSVIALHLQAERAAADHPIAQGQLRQLASNPGVPEPAVRALPAAAPEAYGAAVADIAGRLADLIAAARTGATVDPGALEGRAGAAASAEAGLADQVAAAALIRYLGGEPVRDVTFWAIDRDPTDSSRRALDVRVLVTRRELNDLILALDQVLEAMRTAEFTQMAFFESLQAVLSQVHHGESADLAGAETLADSDLLPVWIETLPYRSTLLDMSDAVFESLSADERARLITGLEAKRNLYVDISENADLWTALDDRVAVDDRVYPLSLGVLP